MTEVRIERRPLADAQVQAMLARLNEELLAETPEGGTNFFTVDHDEFTPGDGAFFIALVDGTPRGCGAYRRIDGAAAEVKRMWTDPAARGAGVGAAVLTAIIDGAVTDGYTELRLETGEYLTGAMALYRRFGFVPCEPWGEYVGVPHSHTMSRPIG